MQQQLGNATSTNDEDAMRMAFQQFMMTGRHGDTAANSQTNDSHPFSTTVTTPDLSNQEMVSPEKIRKRQQQQQQQQQMKKAEKRYWQIFQNFAIMVRDEWLQLDDEAYKIVEAVSNIRNRLAMEDKLLKNTFSLHHDMSASSSAKKEWASHAHHPSTLVDIIQSRDVELALSHDLEQHEQMMSGLRSVFSSLSECHESLMRQMEIMMKHHSECCKDFHEASSSTTTTLTMVMTEERMIPGCTTLGKAASLTQVMARVLDMLSQELYRKQCLVHMILDTVHDALFEHEGGWRNGKDHDDSDDWEEDSLLSPQMVASQICRKRWSRDDANHGSCIDSKVTANMFDLLK
jgi:hypothetical protein